FCDYSAESLALLLFVTLRVSLVFFFRGSAAPAIYTLSYTTLFRSRARVSGHVGGYVSDGRAVRWRRILLPLRQTEPLAQPRRTQDRKSTRLNSSHLGISYAVFCLKKKKKKKK